MLRNPIFYLLFAFFASLAIIPSLYRFLKNRKPHKKMELIKNLFDKYFSHWNIDLPNKIVNERLNVYVNQEGWLIQYCFGVENGLEYMDFYAYHNMTNDSHIRIYENGETKDLPAYWSGYQLTNDGSGKRIYDEHNAEVTRLLIEKGFDQFTINMAISAGMAK